MRFEVAMLHRLMADNILPVDALTAYQASVQHLRDFILPQYKDDAMLDTYKAQLPNPDPAVQLRCLIG